MDFILQTFHLSKESYINVALDVQSGDRIVLCKKYLFLVRSYRDFLFILYSSSSSNVTLPHTLVTIVSLNVAHALPPFIRHSGHPVACDEFYANIDRLQYLSLVYKRPDWQLRAS